MESVGLNDTDIGEPMQDLVLLDNTLESTSSALVPVQGVIIFSLLAIVGYLMYYISKMKKRISPPKEFKDEEKVELT